MLLRILVLPLLLAAPVWACLNTPATGTDLDGHSAGSRYAYDIQQLRRSLDMTPESLRPKSATPPAAPAKRLEADALELVYAGNYAAARPLLERAEEAAPGDYSIAANLGTVCELVGDNAAALKWISTAMRRNPDSHRGTEWVHVLILKAKLADATAAAVSAAGSASRPPLIDVPDRLDADTPILVEGVARPADEVREAILYQLGERMVFVKPKDPYVADLLFALARLNANLVNIESASGVLTLSKDYGYSDDERIFALHDAIAFARFKSKVLDAFYLIGGFIAFVGLLIFAYRRKWFFLTRSAYDAHRAQTAHAARIIETRDAHSAPTPASDSAHAAPEETCLRR